MKQIVQESISWPDTISVERGLSETEISDVEGRFNFIFPPDLNLLLQSGLPIGKKFVNWRSGNEGKIRERLEWPFEGMCFVIEHNDFWLKEWCSKPSDLGESFAIAKTFFDKSPKLIPIYSHRYIPDSPNEVGNPVFSVYQTDIIVYGFDLKTYLRNEFHASGSINRVERVNEKRIEFWSDLIDFVNGTDDAI